MKTLYLSRNPSAILSITLILGLAACSKTAPTSAITDANVRTNQTAVDSKISGMRVVRNDVLTNQLGGGSILSAETGDASKFLKTSTVVDPRTVFSGTFPTKDTPILPVDPVKDTLILGLPIGVLGEERVLGGVITAVSNHDDENLGNLKLTDFPMLHGKLMLAALDTKTPQLILVGCENKCTEASPRVPMIAFPITAVDTQNQLLMIDLSVVGNALDLISMEDPDGSGTGMKTVSTVTKTFDYSLQTLIFDVDSKLTALDAKKNPMPDTTVTVRWYLKSSAIFDPSFIARDAAPGVGFFMTDTAAGPKIKRWSLARFGDNGIKYYVKHVPVEWQPAFASSFDEWNTKLSPIIGRKVFDYEFIPEGDPRNDLLVTGDIRYNIVEWDLVNKATYGGLGPSEGNEYTGEAISANVLIQGPTVMSLYTDWYKVSDQAKKLAVSGRVEEAQSLLHEYSVSADAQMKTAEQHSFTFNKTRSFTIHAERPELADPLAQRNDFDDLPPNVDFKTYMFGYFHDMLTHELGHNLGLRHNFRGNMGATDTGAPRSTSRSVMEYLGRDYRYLDGIGDYDLMAIKYGYTNVKPDHLDWFCTDEDGFDPKNPITSPECTSDDATSDPFSFFEMRFAKALTDLTARGQSFKPVWTQDDMKRELGIAMKGLLSYSMVTDKSAILTNFYGKSGHPGDLSMVKTFVLAQVKAQLCDPTLAQTVAEKIDPAAQKLTQDNISALRETTLKFFKDAGVDLGFDTNCSPMSVQSMN